MLTLRRPDDWHVHLRDGQMLATVAPHHRAFGRVLAMPNLVPPIGSAADGLAYAKRIASSLPDVVCYLAAYLMEATDADELQAAHEAGIFLAVKWYPRGATTHADQGVRTIDAVLPVIERMAEIGMPLCVHGEVTDPGVDIFDRERVFLDRVLAPLLHRFPTLRCIVEHATTREAVAFVRAHPTAAATVTPHHLIWTRNAMFDGGLRPHAYCLPVAKRARDRDALRAAVTSGDARFFAGTDSAPHAIHRKEADCGCAGVFNAPTAISAYAQVFDEAGALPALEGFLSVFGARFYGLAPSEQRITLVREPWTPPLAVTGANGEQIRVFLGGQPLQWRISDLVGT